MNIPSIPNNFYQIILCLLIGYFFYQLNDRNSEIKTLNQRLYDLNFNSGMDKYYRDSSNSVYDLKRLEKTSDKLLTTLRDSTKEFTKKELIEFKNKNSLIMDSTKTTSERLENASNKLSKIRSEYDNIYLRFSELSESPFWFRMRWLFLVMICFYLIFLIGKEHSVNQKINALQLHDKWLYQCCQSCARNFSPLIKYGTEVDGMKSSAFCMDCYENGHFTNEDLTERDVIKNINRQSRFNFGVSKFVKELVRWKKNPYPRIFDM
jgi:hypothetical protein